MFVTVFYGILNTRTGEYSFSNAGHNPPYIVKPDGSFKQLAITGDVVMGVLDNVEFSSHSLSLDPGDALFLYTDGVTEAMNESLDLFTEERLENILRGLGEATPKEMIDAVSIAVDEFTGNENQSDDITMMALRYMG